MIRRKLLPVLVLSLALSACSAQASPITPSLPALTAVPGNTSHSAPVPAITDTPIPSATVTPLPPKLPVVASPTLAKIDFQDENYGWGIAVNNNGAVLRTVDRPRDKKILLKRILGTLARSKSSLRRRRLQLTVPYINNKIQRNTLLTIKYKYTLIIHA